MRSKETSIAMTSRTRRPLSGAVDAGQGWRPGRSLALVAAALAILAMVVM